MPSDDPLVRLARERERLSAAQLPLSEAAEGLAAPLGSDRAAFRDAAASDARSAARTAAAVSAQVQAVAEAAPG